MLSKRLKPLPFNAPGVSTLISRNTTTRNTIRLRLTASGKSTLLAACVLLIAANQSANAAALFLGILLFTLLGYSVWQVRRLAHTLRCTLQAPDPVFRGQTVHVPLSLNEIPKHAALRIHFQLIAHNVSPDSKSQTHEKFSIAITQPNPTIALKSTQRGHTVMQAIEVESDYPLGLVSARVQLTQTLSIVVYPRASKHPHVRKSRNHSHAEPEEFCLREYQPGDALKRVKWHHYQTGKGLYVAQPDIVQPHAHWVHWDDYANLPTEARLSAMTRDILDNAQRQSRYGLQLPSLSIGPDQGNAHLHACLYALAVFRDV